MLGSLRSTIGETVNQSLNNCKKLSTLFLHVFTFFRIDSFSFHDYGLWMTDKKTLTLTQLANYLGIPKRTLYNMLEDGRFDVDPIPRTKPRLWAIEHVDSWRLSQ